MKLFQGDGFEDFCINLGGDVYASGTQRNGQPWRIGLQHPTEKSKVMAVLQVSNAAVATSGSYERGSHIVNPHGEESNQLSSITIVGPDIVMADVYATAAYAMGLKGLQWAAQLQGFEVFGVDNAELTHHSPGFTKYLAP